MRFGKEIGRFRFNWNGMRMLYSSLSSDLIPSESLFSWNRRNAGTCSRVEGS